MENSLLNKIFRKPYLFYFVFIFLIYTFLNIFLSGFYNTIPLIVVYAKTVNWIKLGFSLLLSTIIGLLVAFLSILLFIKYKDRKECKKSGFLAGTGSLTGLAAGICPLCVTGIFPLILASLGISFSFASLPFQGIEIQILAIFILLISLFIIKKK